MLTKRAFPFLRKCEPNSEDAQRYERNFNSDMPRTHDTCNISENESPEQSDKKTHERYDVQGQRPGPPKQ